jgi:hypothetical protein
MNYSKRLFYTIGLLALLSGVLMLVYFLQTINVFVFQVQNGYSWLLLALGLADLLWGSWALILHFRGASRQSAGGGNIQQADRR